MIAGTQTCLRAAFVGAVIVTLTPTAAQAEAACQRWDVSGAWTVVQDNGGHANIVVTQGDTILTGQARSPAYVSNGNFDGTLNGSDIKFTIYWTQLLDDRYDSKSDIGDYVGTISPTGRITGTTTKQGHPETHASWYSSRAMGCAHWVTSAPASPPPPVPAKPAIALGRVNPPAGSTPGRPMTICERAEDAALRNSPTYEQLKRQCLGQ